MDIKDIKQIVKMMMENDLGEVEIALGENRVHLKRCSQGGVPSGVPAAQFAPVQMIPAATAAATAAAASEPAAEAKSNLIEIKSPMVGTFYTSPSPDSEPFTAVGAQVGDDSVVCIVEAMKVMNEIKAECSGVIREICVKNAQPVEYGQVLFRVQPA
jgi:acetyl-CoA carboxylase biotin carboxyl carrier protein